jgi:hypothetical protein
MPGSVAIPDLCWLYGCRQCGRTVAAATANVRRSFGRDWPHCCAVPMALDPRIRTTGAGASGDGVGLS